MSRNNRFTNKTKTQQSSQPNAKLPVSKSSQSSNQTVPMLDPHPEESQSPVRSSHTTFGTSPRTDIACRSPCRLPRALYQPYRVRQSHAIPSHHLTPSLTVISDRMTLFCPHFTIATVSLNCAPLYNGSTLKTPHDIDNSNEVTESQDDEAEAGSDHPESESEIPVRPSQSRSLVPASPWNLVCSLSSFVVLLTYSPSVQRTTAQLCPPLHCTSRESYVCNAALPTSSLHSTPSRTPSENVERGQSLPRRMAQSSQPCEGHRLSFSPTPRTIPRTSSSSRDRQ